MITISSVEIISAYNKKGLLASPSKYNYVSQNTAIGNSEYGVVILDSEYCNITSNTLINNGNGITVGNSSNNVVFNNTISDNYKGIYLSTSANNVFSNNTVKDSTNHGIDLYLSTNNTLYDNTVSNNNGYDFYSNDLSINNTITTLTLGSNPTTISFTYNNGTAIKGVSTAPRPRSRGETEPRHVC